MALTDEFQYYLDHQTELAEQYEGKVIVIKAHRVIGAYSSEIEAIRQTTKKHALGTFLVQTVLCRSRKHGTDLPLAGTFLIDDGAYRAGCVHLCNPRHCIRSHHPGLHLGRLRSPRRGRIDLPRV